MKNWIKENLVLVVGLTLPLLLIVLFFVASVIPKALGTPPQYEMLFSATKYEYQKSPDYVIDFKVKDKKLMVSAKKLDDKNNNGNSVRLMAYNGKTETVREITLDNAKTGAAASNGEIVLEETKEMVIDTNPVSPDGYSPVSYTHLDVYKRQPHDNAEQMIDRADKALFKAKNAGRNRIETLLQD